ncbi:NAD-dependent dehydratase [Luteimonas sp. MC1782]|uniref:NAD-dependent dehydratase n=1 Tax=Luteimonas sp. MC1782 TaxID=2760305 RepID=UPI0016017887|nr:NAD-dependent dehydratase [Luteimonas sp. MC1782]MBB1472000.1 NAD-dependent dehydratase [Luteimonas sp. MC1782]
MKLLLVGATGLVGSHVLALALADPRIGSVAAPARRDLPAHPRLLSPRVDFEHLPESASWWQAGAVICTLGTTLRAAGSREAFRQVDYAYPLAVARIARRHGTPTCVLNSAMGADVASKFFYNRIKGELERDLAQVGFTSLTFVRPGLIGGERDEFRPGERAMAAVLRAAAPILPRRWRINPAANIARALIEAALGAAGGMHVVPSEDLFRPETNKPPQQ